MRLPEDHAVLPVGGSWPRGTRPLPGQDWLRGPARVYGGVRQRAQLLRHRVPDARAQAAPESAQGTHDVGGCC